MLTLSHSPDPTSLPPASLLLCFPTLEAARKPRDRIIIRDHQPLLFQQHGQLVQESSQPDTQRARVKPKDWRFFSGAKCFDVIDSRCGVPAKPATLPPLQICRSFIKTQIILNPDVHEP